MTVCYRMLFSQPWRCCFLSSLKRLRLQGFLPRDGGTFVLQIFANFNLTEKWQEYNSCFPWRTSVPEVKVKIRYVLCRWCTRKTSRWLTCNVVLKIPFDFWRFRRNLKNFQLVVKLGCEKMVLKLKIKVGGICIWKKQRDLPVCQKGRENLSRDPEIRHLHLQIQ